MEEVLLPQVAAAPPGACWAPTRVFSAGVIHDILWQPLTPHRDARGWLCELFRHDELPPAFHPVMAYLSMTEPGVARGPHEHVAQADYFCFLGPSNFTAYLWDNRPHSPTFRAF